MGVSKQEYVNAYTSCDSVLAARWELVNEPNKEISVPTDILIDIVAIKKMLSPLANDILEYQGQLNKQMGKLQVSLQPIHKVPDSVHEVTKQRLIDANVAAMTANALIQQQIYTMADTIDNDGYSKVELPEGIVTINRSRLVDYKIIPVSKEGIKDFNFSIFFQYFIS